MKKLIILFVAMMATSFTYSQVVTNGLIGYWSLDGHTNDSAGVNNWNATNQNLTLTDDRSGNANTAYSFGNNSKLIIPAVTRTTKSMAVSIWVYPTVFTTSPGNWLINQRDAASNDQFQIMYNETGTFFGIAYGPTQSDWIWIQGNTLTLNQWNHVVLQTQGTTGSSIDMWVNNIAQTPATLPGEMNYNLTEDITVGQTGWANGGQLYGKVDEVALFNRVLTALEVDLIYNNNNNPSSGGGLWTASGTDSYHLGKIGVGTNTFDEKLNIEGNLKLLTNSGSSPKILGNNGLVFESGNEWAGLHFKVGKHAGSVKGFRVINYDSENLFYVETDGNVGIGTTTPSTKLDVDGIISAGTEIRSTVANPGFLFDETDVTDKNWHLQVNGGNFKVFRVNDARTTWDEFMTIDGNNGNVGIGTSSPNQTFHVNGTSYFSDAIELANNKPIKWEGSTYASIRNEGSEMKYGADNAHYFDVNGTRHVAINSAGRLGIGTISPSKKLVVDSEGISDITSFQNTHGSIVFGHTSGLASMDLGASQAFRIRQQSQIPFYLNSSGYLGIGTTTPEVSLHVVGNSRSTELQLDGGSAKLAIPSTTGGWARGLVYYPTDVYSGSILGGMGMKGTSTTLEHIFIGFGASPWSTSEGMHVKLDGKVGVGTSAPNRRLEVKETNQVSGTVRIDALTGQAGVFEIAKEGTVKGQVYVPGNSDDMHFWVNGTVRANLDGNGNLGIGTTDATEKLTVASSLNPGYTSLLSLKEKSNNGNTSMGIDWHFGGASGFPWGSTSRIEAKRDGTSSSFDMLFHTADTGVLSEKMVIKSNGNVGIGTSNVPTGYKLAVDGKIVTKEVNVTLNGWSDFVFENDYHLPTLKEVEDHIAKKGHLKDIPSAAEVEKSGVSLGEMDAKLLQKIEELTLYTIAQEKKLSSQEDEIEELKDEVKKLKELLMKIAKLEAQLTKK